MARSEDLRSEKAVLLPPAAAGRRRGGRVLWCRVALDGWTVCREGVKHCLETRKPEDKRGLETVKAETGQVRMATHTHMHTPSKVGL